MIMSNSTYNQLTATESRGKKQKTMEKGSD